MKYCKYDKIIEDYKSGAIDKGVWTLVFDNDGGFWSHANSLELTCEEEDRLCGEMEDKYGTPDGYADLVNLARDAGIQAEWC